MTVRYIYLFFFLCLVILFAQAAGVDRDDPALTIAPEDMYIEASEEGGFHLFIRAKSGLGSVLITESTRDPSLTEANFAFRAPQWNPVNGNEMRLLDGNPIPPSAQLWSLISSTPRVHAELGEAFHIFVPPVLHYGHEHTRHGQVYVTPGIYLNIRAFSLPYADYRGSFRDNPFILGFVEEQPRPDIPAGSHAEETVAAFTEIASWSGNDPHFSFGTDDTIELIREILERENGRPLDIVICLDTTASMRTQMVTVRQTLVPMLRETLGSSAFRVGIVQFKDYFDEYLTRLAPFTSDLDQVQRTLNRIIARGGGDIPEAVHEALYHGATRFPWEAERRLMILIGDAPPHPRQRGRISQEMVQRAIHEQNLQVHAIIVPLL